MHVTSISHGSLSPDQKERCRRQVIHIAFAHQMDARETSFSAIIGYSTEPAKKIRQATRQKQAHLPVRLSLGAPTSHV